MAKQKKVHADLKPEIEKLLHFYKKSKKVEHVDLKQIADVYFDSDDQKKDDIIKHYTVNGSVLINAVFNNDTDTLDSLSEDK